MYTENQNQSDWLRNTRLDAADESEATYYENLFNEMMNPQDKNQDVVTPGMAPEVPVEPFWPDRVARVVRRFTPGVIQNGTLYLWKKPQDKIFKFNDAGIASAALEISTIPPGEEWIAIVPGTLEGEEHCRWMAWSGQERRGGVMIVESLREETSVLRDFAEAGIC